ncbi:LolA family protein [Tropicibacter oceani]|uniref:Outer membrane lipoprotein carrier protein LolA n=1 Tax=Tropicibacter oceani TaxID=3058420 RepID=A0ABY8QLU9_9RHOB|nr:outer membrane lipoprotein carrier protein LolA [Tropicibacter oceani]WGW04981.1 outer membrane lipoprotein carrier protein LolA [Tropicibacter oceani]
MIRILIAFATLITLAMPAQAQQLSLNEISRYLNTIQAAQGAFTQINSDGTISTGQIAIKRPGKVRFDYNPPERALVLASAGSVYILDRKLNAQPETYPLNQTPLSIILDRNVNLAQAGMVKNHSYDGTATVVTAQDPKRPEYGSIQLKFTANPVELRQWIITDGDGNQTTVVLGGLEKANLPNSMFYIDPELAKLR